MSISPLFVYFLHRIKINHDFLEFLLEFGTVANSISIVDITGHWHNRWVDKTDHRFDLRVDKKDEQLNHKVNKKIISTTTWLTKEITSILTEKTK
jgi:flagellar biosynthesis regulator FlaF